jgi:hypothetical protein
MVEIPAYLQSLVQMPEKHWPERRWGARGENGEIAWGPTPEEALADLADKMTTDRP